MPTSSGMGYAALHPARITHGCADYYYIDWWRCIYESIGINPFFIRSQLLQIMMENYVIHEKS